MAAVKKSDFVEIEYTGKTSEGIVFDTTSEKTAKEHNLRSKNSDYSPIVVCIGENAIMKSLEDQIVGKETGKNYTFSINAEDAFGKKDAKMIQLIPMSKFRQQKIQPIPGLQLNIDGSFGVVRTVSGGRCLVDFNHPLAGKDLVYEVKINKIVEDDKEKLISLLEMQLHAKDPKVEVANGAATITLNVELPKEIQQGIVKIVSRVIPSIKTVDFTAEKEKKE
ncbi:MAG TPA: peptidylprolyl isomerase [Candidatus Nanoarchaeia archaeon]|nr:peptidylprolyl isomerase [Candidatus Nanoarchaeia archaeon]